MTKIVLYVKLIVFQKIVLITLKDNHYFIIGIEAVLKLFSLLFSSSRYYYKLKINIVNMYEKMLYMYSFLFQSHYFLFKNKYFVTI